MKYEDYEPYGLGDIYLHLISFVSNYIVQNFDPMEVFEIKEDYESDYAFAQRNMKEAIKAILDEMKKHNQIYIATLNKNINLCDITIKEQLAIEKEIESSLIDYVNESLAERKSMQK